MSCHFFIYDFFQDGRLDALSEVRILQHCDLWTKERRACWIKEAVATYAKLKHNPANPREGIRYFAGRIAGLKSAITAHFSGKAPKKSEEAFVCQPLPPTEERFCGFFECEDQALWGICLQADAQPLLCLCDPCRQEWQRNATAYTTPDGWDWDEDEDTDQQALTRSHYRELGEFLLPTSCLLAFTLFNLLMSVALVAQVEELVVVVGVACFSHPFLRLLFFLSGVSEEELEESSQESSHLQEILELYIKTEQADAEVRTQTTSPQQRKRCALGHAFVLGDDYCNECGEPRTGWQS